MADSNEKKDVVADGSYANDSYYYDLDPRDLTKVDIPFMVEYSKKTKGKILELAAGNGRITIPIAEADKEIWALEYSQQMIKVFQEKINTMPSEIASNIHLFQGDMTDFDVDHEFSLILLPAQSFQLLTEDKDQISCLKSIRKHLSEDGLFIIVLASVEMPKDASESTGSWINLRHYKNDKGQDPWISDEEIFDWENTDPRTGLKVWRTHINKKIDRDRQIIFPEKTYRITQEDGSIRKIIKTLPLKYFYKDQIEELLKKSGFRIEEKFDYFLGVTGEKVKRLIYICKKR
jgi:SAM-dependent methyltransferase